MLASGFGFEKGTRAEHVDLVILPKQVDVVHARSLHFGRNLPPVSGNQNHLMVSVDVGAPPTDTWGKIFDELTLEVHLRNAALEFEDRTSADHFQNVAPLRFPR